MVLWEVAISHEQGTPVGFRVGGVKDGYTPERLHLRSRRCATGGGSRALLPTVGSYETFCVPTVLPTVGSYETSYVPTLLPTVGGHCYQGDFIFAFGDVRLDVAVVLARQPS